MGSRAGYFISQNGVPSWVIRRQEYLGGSKEELMEMIRSIALQLMDAKTTINKGDCALRHDLYLGRLFCAAVKAIASSKYNSIEIDFNCDIDEHGVFEIVLVKWNEWWLYHHDLNLKNMADETNVADIEIRKQIEQSMTDAFGHNKEAITAFVPENQHLLGKFFFEDGKALKDGLRVEWEKNFKEY